MNRKKAAIILETLRKIHKISRNISQKLTPFQILIITIISQNTTDKNTQKAYENMASHVTITPHALSETRIQKIESWLKQAGLYRRKAKTIKNLSTMLAAKPNFLDGVLKKPLEKARTELMQFPGVGPKTADVFSLFASHKSTIPVDTHVHRVSKRLTLCPQEANVEGVRSALMKTFSPHDYRDVHLLLIAHGREYCKARKPRCACCILSTLCPWKEKAGRLWIP